MNVQKCLKKKIDKYLSWTNKFSHDLCVSLCENEDCCNSYQHGNCQGGSSSGWGCITHSTLYFILLPYIWIKMSFSWHVIIVDRTKHGLWTPGQLIFTVILPIQLLAIKSCYFHCQPDPLISNGFFKFTIFIISYLFFNAVSFMALHSS